MLSMLGRHSAEGFGLGVLNATMRTSWSGLLCPAIIHAPYGTIHEFHQPVHVSYIMSSPLISLFMHEKHVKVPAILRTGLDVRLRRFSRGYFVWTLLISD